MPIETFVHDTAEHLRTDKEIALYIEAVLEDGDPALVRDAIGVVARARGMTQIARDVGLSRDSLYQAIATDRHSEFDTVVRALKALDLQISAKPAAAAVG